VGRTLKELGIQMIPAYSPEANHHFLEAALSSMARISAALAGTA
jgi:hypothetical protein